MNIDRALIFTTMSLYMLSVIGIGLYFARGPMKIQATISSAEEPWAHG
jgi:hypothetical protein